jgi:hypothetical protein
VIAITEIAGLRALVELLPMPEEAPPEVREGLARRNIVNTGGTCPCGARLVVPNRAVRRKAQRKGVVLPVRIEHEDGCPAITETLLAAIEQWRSR